jgi:putative ABC transport system ATP-binding protein
MTIRQYLSLSCPTGESWRMLDALEAVGLAEAIAGLEHGLDTKIAATGYPLSTVELLKLKLASAILARPRILVLTRLFDLIEADDLASALAVLREQAFTTVIYFSNREAALGCSRFLHIEAHQQRWFDDFAEFVRARRERRSSGSDLARLRAQIGAPGKGEPA